MGLVIWGYIHCYRLFLVSTQMVEHPSFCFHADCVFQQKTSCLCECSILKSVDLWTLVFCSLPLHKIVPDSWTFSAPCVCTFHHGWKVTESFSESLHFVSLGLCSWGSESKLRNLMKISVGSPCHHCLGYIIMTYDYCEVILHFDYCWVITPCQDKVLLSDFNTDKKSWP